MGKIRSRVRSVSAEQFRELLEAKKIRAASLEDVNGTHHQRVLYQHPNTGQYWVEVPKEYKHSLAKMAATLAFGWFLIVGNYDGGPVIVLDEYDTVERCEKAREFIGISFKDDCVPSNEAVIGQ